MRVDVVRSTPTPATFRAAKVMGMFDVPAAKKQVFEIHADLDLPEEWQIGAIVGSSGTGKSSIAFEAWPDEYVKPEDFDWSSPCLLDDFPEGMLPKEIAESLTAVGLSSAPVWLRPYAVLSTGQRFRADLARALASKEQVVFDEFTSVVDRTVAKAASVAVAKLVRRSSKTFVAVTCHKDVLPWLEPDWVFDTDTGSLSKERLHRPSVGLCLREGSRSAWRLFRGHHYLSGDLHKSCRVLLAYVTLDDEERLAGFFSLLPVAGHAGWWRGHRTVVLPDYQGLGIGNRMVELGAEMLWQRERKRYRATTSAPSLVAHRRRHPDMWKVALAPGMRPPAGRTGVFSKSRKPNTSAGRLTASFIYVPEDMRG